MESWVLSVCHISQNQGPFHKCAWIDDDFKNRCHWKLNIMSNRITSVSWGPTWDHTRQKCERGSVLLNTNRDHWMFWWHTLWPMDCTESSINIQSRKDTATLWALGWQLPYTHSNQTLGTSTWVQKTVTNGYAYSWATRTFFSCQYLQNRSLLRSFRWSKQKIWAVKAKECLMIYLLSKRNMVFIE